MTELNKRIRKLHLLKNYPQKGKTKQTKMEYNKIKTKLNKNKKLLKKEIEEKEEVDKKKFYSNIKKTRPLARLCKVLEIQNKELESLTKKDGTFTKNKKDTLNYLADELIGKEDEIEIKIKNQDKIYTKSENKTQIEEIINEKRMEIAIKELKKKKSGWK